MSNWEFDLRIGNLRFAVRASEQLLWSSYHALIADESSHTGIENSMPNFSSSQSHMERHM